MKRPRLHPGHKHQWTDADPNHFTRGLAICTICQLEMPAAAVHLDQPPGLCDAPDPDRPDIHCDYHCGHSPLDAWPALNNPNPERIVYAHGNSKARHWWKEPT